MFKNAEVYVKLFKGNVDKSALIFSDYKNKPDELKSEVNDFINRVIEWLSLISETVQLKVTF